MTVPNPGQFFGSGNEPLTGSGLSISPYSIQDIICEETDDSRDFSETPAGPRNIFKYHLAAPPDLIGHPALEGYWRSVVANTCPAEWDGMVPRSMDVQQRGGGIALAKVEYGLMDATAEFDFDTTGGQTTARQSFGTRKYGTGPNFQGLINCNNGRVDGVDITIPTMTFSITRSFVSISNAYRNLLHRMTGKVNSGAFWGTAAGETLFLGAQGRKAGRELWRVRFAFACSENAANLSVGAGTITVTRKDGWEYLWVYTEEEEESGRLIPRPKAAFVEQVYLLADFAALGIGT